MHTGNFVLTLHSHLPYVLHHGDWPHGTDWLCEAVAESYIPLLNVFNELLDDGVRPGITISLSPVLCEQIAHPEFPELFLNYCRNRVQAAREDARHFEHSEEELHYQPLAKFWEKWYSSRARDFDQRYGRDVIAAFAALQESEAIEIITCGATHGYYPLLAEDKSIRLQMRVASANYRKHFGRNPNGAWLPECAYRPAYPWRSYLPIDPYQQERPRPAVEQLLADEGIEYFFVDQHMFERSTALGLLTEEGERFVSVHADDFQSTPWNFDPTALSVFRIVSGHEPPEGNAVAFARHQDIAMQVWSGESGYPGDPDYLDFHKKYFRSNLRYWRVTDNNADMQYKQPYVPVWTRDKIELNAHHFIQSVEGSLSHYRQHTGREGSLCVTFDTELFGHWWFEGPAFIKAVLRGLHESPFVNAVTAGEQVRHYKPREIVSLPEGSWGEGGHHKVWMNDHTKWMWYLIYQSEKRFDDLTTRLTSGAVDAELRRILNQALRELMLLQASDWEFLVSTFSAKDYAERRFSCHHSDFSRLCDLAEAYADGTKLGAEDEHFLDETEQRNSLFRELEFESWA